MLKYVGNGGNRIQDGLRKYGRIVAQARQRGMNERDTGDIVKVMLGDILGYDPFFDVTAEATVRGASVDYAILAEGRLEFLLAVKGIGTIPHAAHLLRLSGSGAPPYAQWALLTNADIWACYRLGVGADRHAELVFRASLLEPKPLEEKEALFFLISKEGVRENALQHYWEERRVLNPCRLAALLLSEDILNMLRREVQRTAGYRVDRQTLYGILTREVLRPEAMNSEEEGTTAQEPQCFAYVHNPHDPSTWKLRYRNEDGSPNAELLTLAVAVLSGDTRATGIPADDVPFVKERFRQAYAELGVAPEELPDTIRI